MKTIRYHVDPVALRDALAFGRDVYLSGQIDWEPVMFVLVCDMPGGVGYSYADRSPLGMGTAFRCGCCEAPLVPRDPDPWEGRLDGYCERCALIRCDAYPGACEEPEVRP